MPITRSRTILLILFMMALAMVSCSTFAALTVAHVETPGAFPIVSNSQTATVGVDNNDFPGVIRAANDLADDIGRVSGKRADVIRATGGFAPRSILIGTIGKSTLIDGLIKAGQLKVAETAGKWESYTIQVVAYPMPGVDTALVIAGSDKRGTIYGIYDLSEKIGVSPWYWWADVPVKHSDALFVPAGRFVQGPPKVKYRGIFINDEEPALGPWSREKFGGVNSKMYTHMFELILRLKGNYLWPAMWGKSFTEDDPQSPRLADEYGIVIGTSHHEPMMRAQEDWTKHHKGPWSYATNQAELDQFWQQGIERNKDFETITTIGMRGDGDEPMIKGGDMQANTKLLERIVTDQRAMIARTINPDVTKVPQLWALYKEVADYYEHGMRVPDDVTLLWCDDNWGNVRRLPTAEERKRSGGAGIYYHFDYVGSPRSYKWINTNPLPKVWEQMNLAYRNGADRIWIVNVGDLKPMEIPIEFFMQLAWDPDAMSQDKIGDFTRHWAEREFGPAHAQAIADIVTKYGKYNGWRKPELLDPTTFSLINYQEAERVLEGWRSITADAEKVNTELPPEYRDAFYQLVLYPTKASATVVELYIAAGRNRLYAAQQRASTNDQAERVAELFKQDQQLSDYYNHTMSSGKWNHMMDEVRIGYTSWSGPKKNVMPEVKRIQIPQNASLGVAVEGSDSAWPGGGKDAVLPPFDSINQQRYWIDVFNRGNQPFAFTATPDRPWIKVSQTSGEIEKESRLWVTVDWSAAPVGNTSGTITVTRAGGETVAITLEAVRSEQFTRENIDGALGGLTGPIAIAAESATKNIEAGGARWMKIPDYGRGASGMEVFPVTAASTTTPPRDSPCMEYKVLVANPGEAQVDVITSPTLDYMPGRGLRLAVSFDDQQPKILDAYANQGYADPSKRADISSPAVRDWGKWVEDNSRTLKSSHMIDRPGIHTLKVWMVDPGVVVEKLVVHHKDVRPSYFGPPEVP